MSSVFPFVDILTFIPIIIYLALIVLLVYALVLWIQFAHKGMRAFDLYIAEKTQNPPHNEPRP